MEENKISSDLIRGHIDTIILYSLTESDKFAQQISDFIDEKSEKKYQINQATLYSSLKRLETLKFVTSYRFDCDEGGRRKFFKITELGNDFVKENLTNWSYSRVIIDKLMGCEYTPSVYVSQNNNQKPLDNTSENNISISSNNVLEKQPESEVNTSTVQPEINVQNALEKPITEQIEENKEKTEIVEQAIPLQFVAKLEEVPTLKVSEEKPIIQEENVENSKEVNFRNILNGLINSVEKPAPVKTEEKEKIELQDVNRTKEPEPTTQNKTAQAKPITPKFNETIEKTTYSPKNTYVGKADFSDLSKKYAIEGYKIRVSSKGPVKVQGNLKIAKLNFFSLLFFLIVPIIESLLLQFVAKISIISSIPAIVSLSLVLLALIYFGINFIKNKEKVVFKNITFDRVLNSCIIVFNLLLVTFALNFVFGVDLSDKFNLFSYLIVPIVTSINIIIYYVIELILYKSGKFKYVKK